MERLRLGDVPAVVASRGAPEDAARRGTVLIYHALGASKDLHADDLTHLADRGLLAVGLDAIAHGERRLADGLSRFFADPIGALMRVVAATAAEVPGLLDRLAARGWAHPGRIGIAGVSLGGFVSYAAALADRRISAAACLLASPDFGADASSPHRYPDRFFPLALLSVTAGEDAVVPPGPARALHASLAARYAAAPARLRLVELPGERHGLTAAGRARATDEAEVWLERWVGGDEPARPAAGA